MAIQKPVLRERPEQTFFEDTSVDRLMAFVLSLSAETYVLRDRVMRLEEMLIERGTLPVDGTEHFARSSDAMAAAAQDRAAFVTSLMENIAGRQKSNGAS